MVIFEGKAFDEKQVQTITAEEGCWSPSVKNRYRVVITFNDEHRLIWDRYLPETAISKVNQLVQLVNAREEELLKLKAN